jgi:hypothetical protein
MNLEPKIKEFIMNKELKHLLQLSIGLFLILILFFNIYYYFRADNFITGSSKASQVITSNRLRAPNINRPSEKWSYPKLTTKDPLELVALKQQNKIIVVNTATHKAIYTINAQINVEPQAKPLHVLKARGQEIYHIVGAKHTTAKNWLGISKGHYIEAPVTGLDGQRVPHRLTKINATKNTILVSKPDAKWLQSIPQSTPLVIKEGK